MLRIAPSILAADFSDLKNEVKKLEYAGCDYIHIDVMDGNFTDNITIGAQVVKAIRKYSGLFFDVHLMVVNPEKHIENFAQNGADGITVHAEATVHLDAVINKIKSLGKKACVAINPATSICQIEDILEIVDMVLVMTVNPGYGGQKIIPYTLKKVEKLYNLKLQKGYDFDIEVDGGITDETVVDCVKAGANVIVAGSYVFSNDDIGQAIKRLRMNAQMV